MDPKLAILFMLIATVIGLSHLTEENLSRMRRQFMDRNWREFVPMRRKSYANALTVSPPDSTAT
jgi:hypothetical protein